MAPRFAAAGNRPQRRVLPVRAAVEFAEERVINPSDPLRLFLAGPLIVLILTGCLAVVALAALLLGRLSALARLGTQASARMTKKIISPVPALWGLAAGLLLFLLAAAAFHSHKFTFFGLLVLAAGLALAGLGLAAAALSVGMRLSEEVHGLEQESLDALRLGLGTLALAAAVPVAGWLLVLGLIASGIGTVLEVWVTRRT